MLKGYISENTRGIHLIQGELISENFDDFGQSYRPPVFGNGVKWSVGPDSNPPFL